MVRVWSAAVEGSGRVAPLRLRRSRFAAPALCRLLHPLAVLRFVWFRFAARSHSLWLVAACMAVERRSHRQECAASACALCGSGPRRPLFSAPLSLSLCFWWRSLFCCCCCCCFFRLFVCVVLQCEDEREEDDGGVLHGGGWEGKEKEKGRCGWQGKKTKQTNTKQGRQSGYVGNAAERESRRTCTT